MGLQGPQGTNTTATSSFAANVGSGIAVTAGGVLVPLASQQILPVGITVNAANTIFSVAQPGTYRISYTVNTTAGLIMGTRLVINGSAVTASTIPALLSLSGFSSEIIVSNPTTVSLELFGISTTITLVSGAGATLTIIRLA